MGNLIWHEYSRLISVSASVYAVWAGFWGLFYRKFFWDFVGGTIRDPGGIQPSPNAAIFISLIVRLPIVQIFAMVLAMIILCIELPLPAIKKLSLHRSLVVRLVLLLFQAFLTILFYQGTNAAIWSLIAAGCYGRAIALGEILEEAKSNRGKGGEAWCWCTWFNFRITDFHKAVGKRKEFPLFLGRPISPSLYHYRLFNHFWLPTLSPFIVASLLVAGIPCCCILDCMAVN